MIEETTESKDSGRWISQNTDHITITFEVANTMIQKGWS